MRPIEFHKASGAGNDFIIIDARDGYPDPDRAAPLVRAVCRRGLSIGADGVIMIVDDPELDFAWRFFNADGGEAEMCGNGARCAARFAHERGIAGPSMRFRTLAGPIEARVIPGGAHVGLTAPRGFRPVKTLTVAGRSMDVWFIDTGVPHALVFVDELERLPIETWGPALRRHAEFAPAGANADFVGRTAAGIALRTFERGVEAETLACGTGATAAALVAHLRDGLASPVSVLTRSGETLEVGFTPGAQPGEFSAVYLEGPARLVARGEILDEAL